MWCQRVTNLEVAPLKVLHPTVWTGSGLQTWRLEAMANCSAGCLCLEWKIGKESRPGSTPQQQVGAGGRYIQEADSSLRAKLRFLKLTL